MSRMPSDEQLASLSLPELLELIRRITEEIELRAMQMAH